MKLFKNLAVSAILLGLMAQFAPVLVHAQTLPETAFVPSYSQNSQNSANWSGYGLSGGGYTGVGATWTVPSVDPAQSPAPFSADATWVGIGGLNVSDLIQAGTEAIVMNSTVTYAAWYEILPGNSLTVPLLVHAGDSVSTSVTEISPNLWHILIKNNTSGQNYETNVPYVSGHASAEWIQEMAANGVGGSYIPLDSFSPLRFTNAWATAGNTTLSPQNGFPLVMITAAGQTLAIPSGLDASGNGFSVTRQVSSQASVRAPITALGMPAPRLLAATGIKKAAPKTVLHKKKAVVRHVRS